MGPIIVWDLFRKRRSKLGEESKILVGYDERQWRCLSDLFLGFGIPMGVTMFTGGGCCSSRLPMVGGAMALVTDVAKVVVTDVASILVANVYMVLVEKTVCV